MIAELEAHETERFLTEFYPRDEPVLVRGLVTTRASAEEIARTLDRRIATDPSVLEQVLWHDVRPELIAGFFETPPLVTRLLDPEHAWLRPNHVRVWLNPQGNHTPWHYDGQSIHVLNLQLKGRKTWRIVAPETPLPCTPFTSVCPHEDYDLSGKRVLEFETREGDMLFLPRYWYHSVDAHDGINVNVNWVLTPKADPPASFTARREAELLRVKDWIRPLMTRANRAYHDQYAGVGRPARDWIARDISTGATLRRLVIESLRILPWLATLPGQVSIVKRIRRQKRTMRGLLDSPGTAQA